MVTDWIPVLSNVGFPAAVTLYLLVRVEARLEQLSGCITKLTETIFAMRE